MAKPIRLLILGTSNSVLRGGYTSVFEEDPDIDLVNRSFGGSPSVILAYQLGREELPESDFCILDTAVNDANWSACGIFRVDLAKEMLSAAIHEVRRTSKATPIVLMLPNQNNVYRDTSGVLQAQREVCETTGTLYVDGAAFLRGLIARSDLSLEECFGDPTHLSLPVARELGHLLKDYLLRQAEPAASQGAVAAQPFSTLALADVAGPELERIERSSSLVGSRGFVALKPGESLQFDVPAGHRLGALAVNAVKSFGYLEITHGDGVVHKDVRFGETAINPLNNIVLKVVPMLARVGSGPCRLRLLDRAPDAEIEPTIPASAPVVDREPGLEIASVVFIRDDQPAPDDGGHFQLELKAPGGHAATGEAASAAPVATVKFSYTEDDALNYGVVELLREMGRLLIDLNRPKEADHFLTRAQSLRPNGPAITRLVELARSLETQHPG